MAKKLSLAVALLLLAVASLAGAQSLKQLAHPAPDGAIVDFLLTDGTVMVQGNNANDFWKLTPDQFGSYLNGTWSQLASLPSGYDPYANSSAVLADGRVVFVGGEYNFGNFVLTNLGTIYDPTTNTWTPLKPPSGWYYIGDSPSAVLPDGRFVIGNKLDKRVVALDPKTLTWQKMGYLGKRDFNAEEGWTLMPDGTILTFDVKSAPHAERYLPSLQQWIPAGTTIVDLHSPHYGGPIPYGNGKYYYPPGEVGPAILRPDGTVFATGATPKGGSFGHTAIYHPGAHLTDPGAWTVGPDFPSGEDAGDSFAVLLPNGNVLVEAESGNSYEFDGTNLTAGPYAPGSYIVLPTGEVLVGGTELYTSSGSPSSAWEPVITNAPTTVTRGSTYQISGMQFNGLSQAAAFGDEFETATNYPLVRITNNSTGHVFYARTHDHSTMAVATGTAAVWTYFDVPAGMETGAGKLEVVANGIPSQAVNITVN